MRRIEKAIKNLGVERTVRIDDSKVQLACLIRPDDRRPFQAPWWKGKQCYLVAVDDDGNFFLRHPGGSIIYWNHKKQEEQTIARSEDDFLGMIEWGD